MIQELIGKTLTSITQASQGDNEIVFTCSDGTKFRMYHSQDCCENVTIDDINGDLQDLVGSPILQAEERTNEPEPEREYSVESYTWTFYYIATLKGNVLIRWFGESNGYYSESVDFVQELDIIRL